jgi:hypothetical protein
VINSALPLAVSLATTVASLLILQILVIATAFGTGDYDRGTPGLGSLGFLLWSVAAVAGSCGLGAGLGAALLRRADVDERGARRWGPVAPAGVALIVAIGGLTRGNGLRGAAAIGIATGVSITLAARLGSRTKGAR